MEALKAKILLDADGRFNLDTRNELRKAAFDHLCGVEELGHWITNIYIFGDGSVCGERHDESGEFVHVLVGKTKAAFWEIWKSAR